MISASAKRYLQLLFLLQFNVMKYAYLYVRVSTDEQKRKGYSLPEQEERLRNHCEQNGMEIKGIFREDYSAKNFNRPEWSKLLGMLGKRSRREAEEKVHILFVKWDRYSRNIEAAYEMLGVLRKMNVQPVAIDQPIDFSIPESTVMLAVYLSIPEAENERRSLNTFYGMRRAKKQGRWPGTAPKGFINRTAPDGRKYIMPKPHEAGLVKWVFGELAKGLSPAEHVRREANRMGLKCGRSNFWRLIRNPIYCGYIIVPPHEDEEMELVEGQHEPIISKTLFYEVQDVLNAFRRPTAKKTKTRSLGKLRLRGLLKCPTCERKLTGSGSRGRHGGRYYYYHCSGNVCKCRYRADAVHEHFRNEYLKYRLSPAAAGLFRMVVTDVFRSSNRMEVDERKELEKLMGEQETMVSNARRRLMKEEIDAEDFRIIKKECNAELQRLEDRMGELPPRGRGMKPLERLLDTVIERFTNIRDYFPNPSDGDGTWKNEEEAIEEQRKLIVSMFPEEVTFDHTGHRTPRLSEPLQLILLINNSLEDTKKRKGFDIPNLSAQVGYRRNGSNTFWIFWV